MKRYFCIKLIFIILIQAQLLDVNVSTTDYLLGLFESRDLKSHLEVTENNEEDKEPSLLQMTTKAIELLSKNPEGYFLFVEGGQIDFGHHDTNARMALDEAAEFSKAIDYAKRAVNEEDTLIIVTADHGHTMTFSGYPVRPN